MKLDFEKDVVVDTDDYVSEENYLDCDGIYSYYAVIGDDEFYIDFYVEIILDEDCYEYESEQDEDGYYQVPYITYISILNTRLKGYDIYDAKGNKVDKEILMSTYDMTKEDFDDLVSYCDASISFDK